MSRGPSWVPALLTVHAAFACAPPVTCVDRRDCAKAVDAGGPGAWSSSDAGGMAVRVPEAAPPVAPRPQPLPVEEPFVAPEVTFVGPAEWAMSDGLFPAISGDGTTVVYASRFDGLDTERPNAHVWRFTESATPLVLDVATHGIVEGDSDFPAVSSDGDVVAFRSASPGLVNADENAVPDVFVYRVTTRETARVSVNADGATFDVSLSPSGRYIVFSSCATNLVQTDTNGQTDVFVADAERAFTVASPTAVRVANGTSSGAKVADDGTVVFRSAATNLVMDAPDTDAFDDVFAVQSDVVTRVSVTLDGAPPTGHSRDPAIAANASSVVAFASDADNLVPGDTNGHSDVFVRDLVANVTERLSVGPLGVEANGPSGAPSLSGEGRYVAFTSSASNLVDGDGNGVADVFVVDRTTHRVHRLTTSLDGIEGDGPSGAPALSLDGRFAVFESEATNLDLAVPLAAEHSRQKMTHVFRAHVSAAPLLIR